MAQVRVPYEDYQRGRLPPVCVLSGQPADGSMRLLTPVEEPTPGGLLGMLSGFVHRVDVRRPRDMLLGRLPVAVEAHEALRRRRRTGAALVGGGTVGLGVAAWAGAVWSPVGAVAALAAIGWGILERRAWYRALPRATAVADGTEVVLDNVDEDFAAAVEAFPPGAG